jgi:hypothetical protein
MGVGWPLDFVSIFALGLIYFVFSRLAVSLNQRYTRLSAGVEGIA